MHVTGYKYEEIAQQLGLPVGTVKSRIFYARKRLQQRFAEYRWTSIISPIHQGPHREAQPLTMFGRKVLKTLIDGGVAK